jgi:hypothetical protein
MSLAPQPRATAPFRFQAVRELPSGLTSGLILEHRDAFADSVRFGPAWDHPHDEAPSAADWLAERIERAAHAEALLPQELRPVYVPAPDAAFADRNAPLACSAAVTRSPLLPQEFCLSFRDSALALAGDRAETTVRGFRRRGFRVAADLRQSQATTFSHSLLLMIDTLSVRSEDLDEPEVMEKVQEAREAGVCILADRPRWRDAEELASLGIMFGCELRADA